MKGFGALHIGTSGWHYKHWIGNFYPPRKPAAGMLAHCTQHFNTVELNNTFYRLPKQPAGGPGEYTNGSVTFRLSTFTSITTPRDSPPKMLFVSNSLRRSQID